MTTNIDTGAHLRSLYADAGGVRAAFSSKVADYVAARPDYPAALFDRLAEIGALPPAATVADLGAGTGLLAHGLLLRGHAVHAVEPNAAMRAAADSMLQHHIGYRSVEGTAEATTLREQSIDLVTAAQAFHWFEVDAARRECLRILKPHGQVALIWNDRVLSDPLHAALDEVFAEFGGARRGALLAHEDRSQVPVFFGGEPAHKFDLPHEHRLSRIALQSLAFSRSYMPERDSAAGALAAQRVNDVFDAFADNDAVVVRYRTVAMVARPGQASGPTRIRTSTPIDSMK